LYDTGLKHLDDCPIQPKIPIYLLVGGCFGLLKLLSLLLNQVNDASPSLDVCLTTHL